MKKKFRWGGTAAMVYAALVVVYHMLPKYEFLTNNGSQSFGVYRCNRITGRVTLSIVTPMLGVNGNTTHVFLEGSRITHLLMLDCFEGYTKIGDK